MKQITAGILLAALAFGIGLFAYRKIRPPLEEEKPPCADCREIYKANPDIETISVAELSKNPGRYEGRIVRVRGWLDNDAGYKTLYEFKKGAEILLAEFEDLKNYKACFGMKEKLRETAGVGNWFDGGAHVVTVGRLTKFGNDNTFRYGGSGFEILCLEEVSR
jgi:hypothetical protein